MQSGSIRKPPAVGGMSRRYRLFRTVMRALGRLLVGFEVRGEEKVPKTGPLIVASNHRRYADPVLVCMAVPRRVQWMAKKEVFFPPLDRFFYFIGSFPVDRKAGGRAALRAALALLSAGWTLGIFPEGTRRRGYDPEDAPKNGVAMLASRGNAPILPVFVGPNPGLLRRLKGERLRVHIGDPIITDNTKDVGRSYRGVSAGLMREIYALGEDRGERVF